MIKLIKIFPRLILLSSIIFQAFAQILEKDKPSALNLLNKGIPHIFGDPTSTFIKTTPKEILWDGIVINCTKSKVFAANAICDQIRKNPAGLKAEEDGTFKFSLFGMV